MYRSRFAFALAMAGLATILLPSSLTAQITFERTYGGFHHENGLSVKQTTDGGYVVAGYTRSYGAGDCDVYLVKTDAQGDTQWTRAYGGANEDVGYSVQQTEDGGYIIAGNTESFGAGLNDTYLVKLGPNGDTLWTRTFGGTQSDWGNSIQQASGSGYVIAGATSSFGAGNLDFYLIRTDDDGDTLWTRTYGGQSRDIGCSVVRGTDGGYIIVGYTESFGAGYEDVHVVKTNARGDTLWTRTFGGIYFERGSSIQQTVDSAYIIAGETGSFGAGDQDIYLIKVNSSGDTLWTRTFGGMYDDVGNSVQQTADGGFIIAGWTMSFSPYERADFYLIKTDANGDSLWTKTYGGREWEEGQSVQQTRDGGFVVVGYTLSFGGGGADVYLVKTDSLGNVAVAEPKTSPTRVPGLSLSCEPNPCRGATTIRTSYIVPRSSLSVYDAQGSRVRTFTVNREPYTVWDGTDELGHVLPSGTYFAVLTAAGQHATARIVLQR